MCVYVCCMYVCMYVCVCIHIYIYIPPNHKREMSRGSWEIHGRLLLETIVVYGK